MTLPVLVLLSVCCLSVTEGTGESDVIGSGDPVKARIRQDVILPCHLEPPFNVSTLTVEWKCNSTFVHVYRSRNDDPTNQGSQFKGRTSLFPEEMEKGNISLLLRNVSKADEGLYICHVPKLNSQVRKGNVSLIVDENVPTDPTDTFIGAIIGAVIGGIGVLTIIGGIGGIIIWIKRGGRGGQNDPGGQNDQPNNDQPEQNIPLQPQ